MDAKRWSELKAGWVHRGWWDPADVDLADLTAAQWQEIRAMGIGIRHRDRSDTGARPSTDAGERQP